MNGHTSSEGSDDSGRPQVQPAVTITRNNQREKKKKRLPPQVFIDHIWDTFSRDPSGNPLAVLPSGCVSPSTAYRGQSNELLSDAYERTADQCRRTVRKRAERCKRDGMRYEDSEWDLDRDFKEKKGHCLNGLGSQRFKLDKDTLLSSSSSTPKSVKRVHEIFENPTFMKNVNGGDVKQGTLDDCWLMGALTALGNVQDELKRICVAYDTEVGIYGFVFYRDGEWIQTIIDDKLYLKSPDWTSRNIQRDALEQIGDEKSKEVYRKTYQTGSKALFFAQCRDENETWVPLVEKAYAKAHGDYASLSGGWMSEGIGDLSGNVATGLQMSSILNVDDFWDKEMSRVNDEFLFGASTGYLEHGYGRREGISEGHNYVVMDARKLDSGERLVKLRDPSGKVGKDTWEGPWGDGSKEWTAQALKELDHTFGIDSVFWMSYGDFIKIFTHLARMSRFRDLDWRCCQRWTAVNVPWKAEYHKKFQFRLTQNSPVCLVVSQLDRRYYVGLWGQYSFHLHFRLHKEDSLDAEDCVASSRGHYLMHRSVSVELPELPAGSYVVYLKVTGERNLKAWPVEYVVRRECHNRVENKKFAQVGESHDLAHSKGRSHMDECIKLCQKKASECQQAERASKRPKEKRQEARPIDRTTPDLDEKGEPLPDRARPTYNSADESSDSPVENWDDIHKANKRASKLHGNICSQAAAQDDYDTEEEKMPDPWSASCVVGIRVYSKDSGLQLRTVIEGDELWRGHRA
ncbi:hypothetical protein CEP54_015759 [Fusarium duplospermum]|uniref:Calpain catalytic domain-containing protein n=1 Tax=Fusarium duplospermum TaxID=1325734 RepID=A0A428NLG0_9HYPO|nr:hypothetical protein CEP54_015759 [Fusarium duplospermum]